MPDTEISKLPPLSKAQLQADDVLAIADISAVETKKVKADDLVVGALERTPNGSIDPNKLDWSQLNSDSISGDDLADGSIADEKLIANTLTARSIAPNAIGSSELANDSVGWQELQDKAVNNAAIGDNSIDNRVMGDASVNTDNLAADSVTVDKLSLNDNDLPGSVIADGTITPEELESDLPGTILVDAAIDTLKLGDLSVTESKIVDSSVTSNKVADAAITDAKIVDVDGTKITNATVGPAKFTNDTFGRGISNNGTNVGITNAVAPATTSGISYDGQGLVTGSVPIVGPDLPPATASEIGAISVPAGSGLTVSDLGAIDHLTSVSAATRSGISYDEHGHITNTVALIGTDLPAATTNQIGAVSIPTANSNPLTVDVAGQLRHEVTGFTATDNLVSVNVDVFGHVNGGSTQLIPSQVPALDASIITTGQFGTTRIANEAITAPKVADYATCLMQESNPGAGDFLGQLWYTPSTAQLRVYSRGSGPQNLWLAVGFGNLQANNLRWGGTFNADLDSIGSVTALGTSEGLTAGAAFPAPSDALSGLYLLCQVAGSNCTQNNIQSQTFTAGDWALCLDATQGWFFIYANGGSGGGGGGGAQYLNDLLDVNIGGNGGPFGTAPRMVLETPHDE